MGAENTPAVKHENHFLRMLTVFLIIFVAYVHYNSKYSGGFILWGYEFIELIYGYGRFAMPVFFMISGYFLFSADGHSESQKSLLRKAKRTLILLIFLKVFYFCMDLVLMAFGIISPTFSELMYNFIVFGDSSAHQWFVVVLFVIYGAHWLCKKKGWDFKVMMPIGIILLVIDFITGWYLPMVVGAGSFRTALCDASAATYVLIGLFFFQLGYYMHKHDDWMKKNMSTISLAMIAVLGMTVNGFEAITFLDMGIYDGSITKGPNLYIGTLFFSFAFFALTFRLKDNMLRCRPIEWMGRNITPWMYVFIMVGTYPLQLTVLADCMNDFVIYQIVGPIVCIALDIIAALLMYFILKKIFGKKKPATVNSVNQC